MRLYSKKFVPCVAVFGLAMLAGCGDTYEVTEVTGMKVIAVGDKVPECTEDNVGEMIFVAKVSETYYCSGKNWAILEGTDGEDGADGRDGVNGEDGKNGENGKDGFDGEDGADGNDGSSCTAKTVHEGVEVSCGGVVVGTIKNGDKGEKGDSGVQGAKGETGAQGAKGETGAQGETGALGDAGTGCSAVDKGNGVVEVTCGDDEPVSLYKAVCGTKSYDPEEKFCFERELYDLCNGESFNPLKFFCDYRDKNNMQLYKTVTIGSQTWMAENLNYNTNTESEINSWCYNNAADYCTKYGRLYTWDVALDACPDGWHLPSNDEWRTLSMSVDAGYTDDANTVGTKLKSTSGWSNGGNGDDSFDFTVLPAGFRNPNGKSQNVGGFGYFWSSTVGDSGKAYHWRFDYGRVYVHHYYDISNYGFSVRCIKD